MNKAGYKKQIIEIMSSLKTYRQEFDFAIETLADICSQRDSNLKEWKEAGGKQVVEYTNKGGATNLNKSPYFLNNLQYNEQILKYLKELGLTPANASRLGVSLSEEKDDLDEFVM